MPDLLHTGRSSYTGWTLIELLIALAIIGILAALALPHFRDDVVRARVSEGVGLATPLQLAVAEYWSTHGRFISDAPCTGASVACTRAYGAEPPQGRYSMNALIGDGGTIIITYNQLLDPDLADSTLVLRPNFSDGTLGWECFAQGAASSKNGVTITGDASPTLPSKYAPKHCR